METIYLAGGCFWGMQRYLDQFEGVLSTQVGYANGPEDEITYEQVCASSGHAETVKVDFDPDVLPLAKLLELYFRAIDPLSEDRQGNDIGIQYRTGIYYTDEIQKVDIRAVYGQVEREIGARLVVEVGPIENFCPAEEYHQKYLEKNPGGYCHIPRELLNPKK